MAFQANACYTSGDGTRPVTGHLENAANVSDWLPDYMNKTDKKQGRAGIFKFHQFRFRKTIAKDNVSMQVCPCTHYHQFKTSVIVVGVSY